MDADDFPGIMDPDRYRMFSAAGTYNTMFPSDLEVTVNIARKQAESRADQTTVLSQTKDTSMIVSKQRQISTPFQTGRK